MTPMLDPHRLTQLRALLRPTQPSTAPAGPPPREPASPEIEQGVIEEARRRQRRRRLGIALVATVAAAAAALAGLIATRNAGSRAPSPLVVDGSVVQAHTLPDDRLLAGPVLLHHRAVWVEGGRRLFVRSLDAHGRTRTIFSTSKTPGAPKSAVWPFSVRGIAAGDGRVAFVESVTPCASAPPRLPRCLSAPGEEVWPYSVTLFAGRPGAIRPVESFMHPACNWRQEPQEVEIAHAGLLVMEWADPCTAQGPVSRLSLRSFSGSLTRVLARGDKAKMPLVAGGLALILSKYGQPGPVKIIRLRTGKTLVRLPRRCWLRFTDGAALDSSGEFALMNDSYGPRQRSCQPPRGNVLRVGHAGDSHMRLLATHVDEATQTTSMAIAGGYVAYARQAGRSPSHTQVVVAAPGSTPTPIGGMKPGPLAFDGHVVATAHHNTVQLAAIRER